MLLGKNIHTWSGLLLGTALIGMFPVGDTKAGILEGLFHWKRARCCVPLPSPSFGYYPTFWRTWPEEWQLPPSSQVEPSGKPSPGEAAAILILPRSLPGGSELYRLELEVEDHSKNSQVIEVLELTEGRHEWPRVKQPVTNGSSELNWRARN